MSVTEIVRSLLKVQDVQFIVRNTQPTPSPQWIYAYIFTIYKSNLFYTNWLINLKTLFHEVVTESLDKIALQAIITHLLGTCFNFVQDLYTQVQSSLAQ